MLTCSPRPGNKGLEATLTDVDLGFHGQDTEGGRIDRLLARTRGDCELQIDARAVCVDVARIHVLARFAFAAFALEVRALNADGVQRIQRLILAINVQDEPLVREVDDGVTPARAAHRDPVTLTGGTNLDVDVLGHIQREGLDGLLAQRFDAGIGFCDELFDCFHGFLL